MDLVKNWNDIENNFTEFQKAMRNRKSIAFKRFGLFANWYYDPASQLFAPSKFLGYRNTTAKKYEGDGSGTETNQILKKFFYKLVRGSEESNIFDEKLISFAHKLNKKINKKVFEGTGGIFLPIEYKKLYETFEADLDANKREENMHMEGNKNKRLITFYERDPGLKRKVVLIHGTKCIVCGFDFEKAYGEIGENYIEAHHINPLHKMDGKREINPNTEMTVLCANCHRMVHRKKNNILSIEELKKTYNSRSRK